MISAILAKLFTSFLKALSYSRFLKLAVICMDMSFGLFTAFNLVRLAFWERNLFDVPNADQAFFIMILLIRAFASGVLCYMAFNKTGRGATYGMPMLIYAFSKFVYAGMPSVLQAIGLNIGVIGLAYTLLLVGKRLFFFTSSTIV